MGRYSKEEKQARFRKIAATRTDLVLDKLRILSNCANTQLYEYSDDEIKQIIKAIETQIDMVKMRFQKRKRNKFNWE